MTEKPLSRAAGSPQVTVHVSQHEIDQAMRRDSSHCMIAEAIKRAVPDARSVSVDLQSIRWTDSKKGLRYIYLTPRVAQLSLVKFDQGDADLAPITFRLNRGQVIRANTRKTGDLKKSKRRGDVPTKKTLVVRNKTNVPEVVGGKAPPIAALSNSSRVTGKRRAFGLRGLGR